MFGIGIDTDINSRDPGSADILGSRFLRDNVTVFAPHKALTLILPGKLTFNGRSVVHRVVGEVLLGVRASSSASVNLIAASIYDNIQ